MTFLDLRQGSQVFLDANTMIYHFTTHPVFGAASSELLRRIEKSELVAYTSAHVVAELMHKLMTVEAVKRFGWTQGKVTLRLRQHPDAAKQLIQFRVALTKLHNLSMQILPVTTPLLDAAATINQQTGLLTNDALVVAVMQAHGLANLASNDADFDRVPGIQRFAPA
jgi:predicted nucleic acid-binding protein